MTTAKKRDPLWTKLLDEQAMEHLRDTNCFDEVPTLTEFRKVRTWQRRTNKTCYECRHIEWLLEKVDVRMKKEANG